MSPEELRELARGSILLRGGMAARGSFMSGMTTYLHKLGPANLGRGYASDWDRQAAALLLPLAFRHRLATVARLLADALIPSLEPTRGALALFDLGGGPSLDSLNALILPRRERPELLARRIAVRVLDVDAVGPAFGARALRALQSEGGPLSGLDVSFEHVAWDWANPAPLAALLRSAA